MRLYLPPQTVDDLGPGIALIVAEFADLCVVLAAEESHGPAVLDEDGGQAVLGQAAYVLGLLEGIAPSAALALCSLAGRDYRAAL
jgi:hypothetical protein